MARLHISICAAAIGVAMASVSVQAHHSIAAKYDIKHEITLSGTVASIEWTNPHIYYYVDVKAPEGSVTRYAIEGGARSSLVRLGWTPHSLKPGDVVTVSGYRAKDGSNIINGRSVRLINGQPVFTGTAPRADVNP